MRGLLGCCAATRASQAGLPASAAWEVYGTEWVFI